MKINEPSPEFLLRYTQGLLPASEVVIVEQKLAEDEYWENQLYYINAVLDQLEITEETPFDVALSLLTSELAAREEKTLIALSEFVKSEEDSYELELEIDKLLCHIEELVTASTYPKNESSPHLVSYSNSITASHNWLSFIARFSALVKNFTIGLRYISGTLQADNTLPVEKHQRKSRAPLRFLHPHHASYSSSNLLVKRRQ